MLLHSAAAPVEEGRGQRRGCLCVLVITVVERLVAGHIDFSVFQTSAVLRASRLPLVRSALQTMMAAYSEVKGRYPILGLMGGAAEIGARQISQVAMRQATPLLHSLEPQST